METGTVKKGDAGMMDLKCADKSLSGCPRSQDHTFRVRFLRRLLEHPMTRGMDIDDPSTTDLRNEIVQSKTVLRTIYDEWYSLICEHLPMLNGRVLELGSGGGFLRERIPGLITSEVFECRNAQLVLDGQFLPFGPQSLRAVVMTNVLHHIPNPEAFLAEACRCLMLGGRILMIEPWVSGWSRMIYRLHHEPFDAGQEEWSHSFDGPLSGANGALPWIIFERDRHRFGQEFPSLLNIA